VLHSASRVALFLIETWERKMKSSLPTAEKDNQPIIWLFTPVQSFLFSSFAKHYGQAYKNCRGAYNVTFYLLISLRKLDVLSPKVDTTFAQKITRFAHNITSSLNSR